jgi:putative ABC transport system permease protein
LFLRENLVTNVLGTLVGLPLGYGMLYGSIKGLVTDTYSFPAAVEPISYIYTVALAVVFVLLSQIVVLRSLRAQNWVEALSLKE